jgi:predicted RNase H-like HicB family nuclease
MTKPAIRKIKRAGHPHPFESYAHIVSPLSRDEGGGFLITFPDLAGCMSDGETEEEAVRNGRDAFESWVSARIDAGKPIPPPAYRPDPIPAVSGRFVTRLPKSVHARLAQRAKAEGVSLNTLVLSYIAEGLGRKAART